MILAIILPLISFKPWAKKSDLYNWIVDEIKSVNTNYVNRKADCITNYCQKYSEDPVIITRLIKTESKFKRYAFNERTSARGLGQHIHRHWAYLLWKVDNGKLGEYINKNKIKNTEKYWFRISYSIEATVLAYQACLKIKKGNIKNALRLYGGWYTAGANKKKEEEYLNFILKGE